MNQATRSPAHTTWLRRGMLIILVLLVMQFITGMVLNLYAALPPTHPGTNGSYAPSIPWALGFGGVLPWQSMWPHGYAS